jgi:hypothetical protein
MRRQANRQRVRSNQAAERGVVLANRERQRGDRRLRHGDVAKVTETSRPAPGQTYSELGHLVIWSSGHLVIWLFGYLGICFNRSVQLTDNQMTSTP